MTFLNRDISWLSFNRRVLDETDKQIPMQERFMFYGITGSNLDEFLITRYASESASDDFIFKKQFKQEIKNHYSECNARCINFINDYGLLTNICNLEPGTTKNIRSYFKKNIWPTLQPITFTGRISPKSSGIFIFIATSDGNKTYNNYIEIPERLPRWVDILGTQLFITIEDLIIYNLDYIFKGMKIVNSFVFRIHRSAEVYPTSDLDNISQYDYIEKTLKARTQAWITCVEVDCKNTDRPIVSKILKRIITMTDDTLMLYGNLVKISDMKSLPSKYLPKCELCRKLIPSEPFPEHNEVFHHIKSEDRLVFHPYESYNGTVVKFIEAAADDPSVISIKITLYRVAKDSKIISALLRAANNKKQVTVLVELKARFDELNNIRISNILKEGGIRIVYGTIDLKTHAKICIVTRQEKNLRIYTHIATGNYNENNAMQYTDYSYFTANNDIGYDATRFFNLLTSEQEDFKSRKLLYAPRNLRSGINELIDTQINIAECGGIANITFKCNSLTDDMIATRLVKAAEAGVNVTLIVRGSCILQPIDNLKIYSIVGRFLEHSRVYIFGSGENCDVFIGSNDIMHRNLNVRNELMLKVEAPQLKERILAHIGMYLNDNVNKRIIRENYSYMNSDGDDYNCQEKFISESY